jgi:hypothetical protein
MTDELRGLSAALNRVGNMEKQGLCPPEGLWRFNLSI